MTIININLCLETSLGVDEINNADDMAKVIIEALGLKDSPVYSCNVDVDIIEEKEEYNPVMEYVAESLTHPRNPD